MGRRPTLSRADNEQTEGVTSQRGVDMRRSSPRLFTTNIAVMLLVLLCPRTAEGTSSPAPDRHGRPHALDLDDIPVDPDRRTCPPESLSNMRLLMETRFDSLGADKLADLLARHSSPQTKQLFGRDVEMLRALLSVAATSSMSDGPPPSTNTAVLWTVYQRQQQTQQSDAPPSPPSDWSLIDFRDRFVKHFGAILCKGLFSKTTSGTPPAVDEAAATTAASIDRDCSLPPAEAALLAFNAASADVDGQRVLRHVLEQLAIYGVAVVDSLFSGGRTTATTSSRAQETLAALQFDELLRAERKSSSCANAASAGSNVCLHPETVAAPDSGAAAEDTAREEERASSSSSLVLLHSHADRINPLVRAIADAIQSGSGGESNGGGQTLPTVVLTPTRVVDVSFPSPAEDDEQGVEAGGGGNRHGRCVPVVPAHDVLLATGDGGTPVADGETTAVGVEELAIVWFLSGAGDRSSGSPIGSTLRVQTRLGKTAEVVQKPGRLVIFAAGLVHEAVLGDARRMQPCLVNRVKIFRTSSA